MSTFWAFLELGFSHIADVTAYDHMVFLLALCAGLSLQAWKKTLWMITAFTIGHSITLALATLKIVTVNSGIVEFLIPTTILLTACFQAFFPSLNRGGKVSRVSYGIVIFFGLIHGLGFSGYLQSLLGKEATVFTELLSFNLGVEFGQIVIVGLILGTQFLITRLFKLSQQSWTLFVSGMAAGISILLMTETKFW
ncbi:MAG: hypothetical protein ACJATA_000462 [Sphingobacteriales bacterium]